MNTTVASVQSQKVQIVEFAWLNQPMYKQGKFGGQRPQLSVQTGPPSPEFHVAERDPEVWPFIESGRFEKTFDVVSKLGEGAYGCVYHVKHKLDGNSYALKKIKIHMEFRDTDLPQDRKQALLSNPAMKEIEAISRLNHKNIVGYKGCWVEAQEPDLERVRRIQDKQARRRKRQLNFELDDQICERNDDDSDYERDFITA